MSTIGFNDLCGIPSVEPPAWERFCPESDMTPLRKSWRKDGLVVLENFLPHSLIDAYVEERTRLCRSPGGWRCPVPYMHVESLRDLALYEPLMGVLASLLGEPVGLHLNLTGFVSTERTWHQDSYLNPPSVGPYYLAVWMALEDVHQDSGPFEFVRGSHKWPLMTREKILQYLTPEERTNAWPSYAERFVTEACQREIERRKATTEKFLGKKGDVLIWHSKLMHQGSKPNIPGTPRIALINHYSGIYHRLDMPRIDRHTNGCWYFVHNLPLDETEGDEKCPR